MKARIDAIIHREQAEYLDRLLPENTGVLAEMEAYASQYQIPIADREVARFLEITVRVLQARRALEIGAAIGYSIIHMARAMPQDGLLISIEPKDEMIRLATGYIERAGLQQRVRIEQGRALEVMPRLAERFDLIYLDAVKEEYVQYLDLAVPMLRAGGVIIADNVLWGGQVAGQIRSPDQQASTEALREFNRRFINHEELLAVVLPVGDGLGYAVKLG
jgi:predicted O-methyltransferase YrrM